MKFSQPPMIRYYVKYVGVVILVALPAWLLCLFIHSWIAGAWPLTLETAGIALFMAVMVGSSFFFEFVLLWEKHWATLEITEDAFIWRCPLRRKRVLPITDCIEIGVYTENAGNGIPKNKSYFSDHAYPQKNMNKQGEMKPSKHLIIFWYTEQLADYLTDRFPGQLTSRVLAYKIRLKRKS